MGRLSRTYSGWGMGLVDLDNDGLKDIFTANSHVNDCVAAFEATEYKQHNAMFRNSGPRAVRRCLRSGWGRISRRRSARIADALSPTLTRMGESMSWLRSLGDAPEFWRNVTPAGNKGLIVKLTGPVVIAMASGRLYGSATRRIICPPASAMPHPVTSGCTLASACATS